MRTVELARRMHELFAAGITPPAVYAKKCARCSLYARCLPRTTSKSTSVERYFAAALHSEDIEA
jgi:CRISPR-associated exonuclease Cas4